MLTVVFSAFTINFVSAKCFSVAYSEVLWGKQHYSLEIKYKVWSDFVKPINKNGNTGREGSKYGSFPWRA